MGKTTAPLLSFGARGAVAQSIVYSQWKGIPYARRYVIPANPRTNKQTTVRSLFAKLSTMWLLAPPLLRAPFEANAQGRPYTPVNRFTGLNVKGIDTTTPPTDMSFFQGSPGARGGLPPAGVVFSGGSGTVTATFTAPQIPDGWSITQAVLAVFEDQDPTDIFTGSIETAFDASDPYAPVVSGLSAGDYVGTAWLEWERPDGLAAYSTSLTDVVTVS